MNSRAAQSFTPAVARRAGGRPDGRHTAGGFTLIEMMVAVVVMAVLLAVAAPGLGAFVRSSRVNAAQSELVSSMMLARSEAAKRGQDVRLIAASGADSSDFSGGWLVWWDANDDGVVDTATGSAEVIRSYPAPAGGIAIAPAAAASSVRFAATGFLSPATARVFNVCDVTPPTKGYRVTLEAVGLADIRPSAPCP